MKSPTAPPSHSEHRFSKPGKKTAPEPELDDLEHDPLSKKAAKLMTKVNQAVAPRLCPYTTQLEAFCDRVVVLVAARFVKDQRSLSRQMPKALHCAWRLALANSPTPNIVFHRLTVAKWDVFKAKWGSRPCRYRRKLDGAETMEPEGTSGEPAQPATTETISETSQGPARYQ